jgi:MYXO-CTERM domain-containing protein
MLVTNHVLSGALIGAAVRRPLPAAALGVVSHFALDAVPHWGKFGSRRGLLRVAVPDGLTGLAVIGAFTAIAPRERRLAVLAGMAGAALPDLDKPSRVFFGRSPFPRAWDVFHTRIQDEAPDRFPHEVAAAVVLGAGALALLRTRRRQALSG